MFFVAPLHPLHLAQIRQAQVLLCGLCSDLYLGCSDQWGLDDWIAEKSQGHDERKLNMSLGK